MQHYNCPTRLLDWTSSQFIATYFAVESSFNKDGSLYIYLFNESILDNIVSKKYKKLKDLNEDEILGDSTDNIIYSGWPGYQSKRNIIQRGMFTISPNIMADHESVINEIFDTANKTGFYFKLIIPKELKIEFLSSLRTMNISADTLFPDLSGLGKSLSHIIDLRSWRNY